MKVTTATARTSILGKSGEGFSRPFARYMVRAQLGWLPGVGEVRIYNIINLHQGSRIVEWLEAGLRRNYLTLLP